MFCLTESCWWSIYKIPLRWSISWATRAAYPFAAANIFSLLSIPLYLTLINPGRLMTNRLWSGRKPSRFVWNCQSMKLHCELFSLLNQGSIAGSSLSSRGFFNPRSVLRGYSLGRQLILTTGPITFIIYRYYQDYILSGVETGTANSEVRLRLLNLRS